MWTIRRGTEAFREVLTAQPLLTNSVAAAGLYGGGDLFAQAIEMKLKITSPNKESINYNRTMRMTVFGMGVAGPLLTSWYPLLHRITQPFRREFTEVAPALARNVNIRQEWYTMETLSGPANRAREVGAKVLFDTVFFQAPYLTCYFFVTGFLEGLTPTAVYDKTRENFHAVWLQGLCFWVPMQTLNFCFVPVMFQPLTVHSVNVVWQTFLSVLYHQRDYGVGSKRVVSGETESDSEVQPPPTTLAMERELKALRREVEDQRATIAELRRATRHAANVLERATGPKGGRPGGKGPGQAG